MSEPVLADTSFFVALVRASDTNHRQAVDCLGGLKRRIVTTAWVWVEVGNFFCRPGQRRQFADLSRLISSDPRFVQVHADERQLTDGAALYFQRNDKGWSLTDCITMTVAERLGITEVLTADHHFTQAGYTALLCT